MKGAGARQPPEEKALQVLLSLTPEAERSEQLAVIRQALENKHCRVVSRAANMAAERSLREHVPDLLRAYPRFLTDPVKRSAASADVAVEALSVYERNTKLIERVQAALAKTEEQG